MLFQQEAASCYTTRETHTFLSTISRGRVISGKGDIDWPPNSSDLTPLEFFLGKAIWISQQTSYDSRAK